AEQKIQRPIHHDAELLGEARQLHQVNAAPHSPRDETGKLKPKDHRDPGRTADRCELSESGKNEGLEFTPIDRGFDVLRRRYRFPHPVLSGWWKEISRFVTIRNRRAIATG